MTTTDPNPPTTPLPTVEGLERDRLIDELERWVLGPLRWLPIVAQVFLTFGAHSFVAWCWGARADSWDGQWWAAWVVIGLLDGALLTTWHARSSNRLPPGDKLAARLAAGIYVPGFLVSILANMGDRARADSAQRQLPPPEVLVEWRWLLAGLALAIPVLLVLVATRLYGRVKLYRDELRKARDAERLAPLQAQHDRAERLREAEDTARLRGVREGARKAAAAAAAGEVAAPPEAPSSPEPRVLPPEPARVVEARPAHAAPAHGGPVEEGGTAGKVDRWFLAEWRAKRDPSGKAAEDATGAGTTTGRKRREVLTVAIGELEAARARGHEPSPSELDDLIATRLPQARAVKGTGARVLADRPAGPPASEPEPELEPAPAPELEGEPARDLRELAGV